MDRQTYRHADCNASHKCEVISIKSVSVKLGIVVCAVNSKDADDDTLNGYLQLDDDNEFPAISRSAFIY